MKKEDMSKYGKFLICSEDDHEYLFWCPGCEMFHEIRSKHSIRDNAPKWDFNGSADKPTFDPSYLTWTDTMRCHSFIKEGKIEFLSDCTHKLSGQTVDLPDIPE